jgi:fructose-bisphosphate aldolase, class II
MPLASIAQELKRAQREKFAVPLFDAVDSHSVDGMIAAAEEKRAPVIIALYTGVLDQPDARALAAYIRARAEDSKAPVSLMLDHGASLEHCRKAISFGFTDVMFDGSKLPLEENIAITKAVVDAAHPLGIRVEAELGHVGSGGEYQSFGARRMGFTDPDSVKAFAAGTGVDFLAVAIGNAHGLYQGEPRLDLELLASIRRRVDIPLVLHGGTGIPEEQFRAAIAAGIAKINVATELFITAGKRLVEAAKTDQNSYFDLGRTAAESFRERCGCYLELFGAAGKA